MAYHRGGSPARTLWPLPGGTGNYLKSLYGILNEVAKGGTADEVVRFIVRKHPAVVSEKAARSYLLVPATLQLIALRGSRVQLTPAGEQFLEARDPRVVGDALVAHVAGVADLLDLVTQEPQRIGLLLEAMHERGFQWSTASQIRYRLRWMEECGLVEQEGRARPEYHIAKSKASPAVAGRVRSRASDARRSARTTPASSGRKRAHA